MVGYLRTSTDDQLLGIDAQGLKLREISESKSLILDQVFTEHESGGRADRPELDRALRHARRIKAYLCVAKLDRLARDQGFLMQLVKGNVPIIFGDLPDLDASSPEGMMQLQLFGMFAEFERKRIGARTREALRILRARGVRLGASRPECRNLTAEARAKGSAASARSARARAIEEQSDVAAVAAEKRTEGMSLRQIAGHLDDEGYPTREGGRWTATQVLRVLRRAAR